MAHTFYFSRILAKRVQFNFPTYSWVVPNIKIHTDLTVCSDTSLVPDDPSNTKEKDILLQNIQKADSSKELFRIIAAHGQLFNQRHVIESLSCLHHFNKEKEFDVSRINITNDPIFEKLCIQLKKYSRVLQTNDVIEALKVLTLLRVPSSSTIFQMLLQLIRSDINNLELNQVVFLDYILKNCETNHLIDAIQLALPLVFQLNVSSKMDNENVSELSNLLSYSSRNNVPQNCVTTIVTALVIHTNNIDLASANSIIFSLTEHRFKDWKVHIVYEKLLHRCLNIVSQNINKFSFLQILKMMERLKEMILLQHEQFYIKEFFDICGDYVINKKLPYISALQVTRILTRINHCHLPLLEYLSQVALMSSENLENDRPRNVLSYVSALSNANYVPDLFEDIKEKIIKNQVFTLNKIQMPWSKFATDLAVLDVYDENLLTKIFSKTFLEEYLGRKNNMLDHLQLLMLYQTVKTFHPALHIDFPIEIYQKAVSIRCSKEVDESMKIHLTKALGGAQYVGAQVQMPLGTFADFVVAFRDGVYPIAINTNEKDGFLVHSELNLPERSDVLCIINHHKTCYSVNNGRLRGPFDLANKTLRKMGYKVLSLPLEDWLNMPDIEKTLYLMREIKYEFARESDTEIDITNNIT